MTETDKLHDELRAAEERVTELRAQNARLQERLLRANRFHWSPMLAIVGAVLSGTLGFQLGKRMVDEPAAEARATSAAAHAQQRAGYRASVDECGLSLQRQTASVGVCQGERDGVNRALSKAPVDTRPVCRCQPGDPLCSCL